ncbi:MAG: hypothetical protein ABIP78_06870 [Pyrinomonadaceae bacterium]
MKSLLTLGLGSFALTFCGLSEKLKGLSGSSGSNTNNNGTPPVKSGDSASEKPKIQRLTAGYN